LQQNNQTVVPVTSATDPALSSASMQSYEQISLIISTNLNFAGWMQVFDDKNVTAALLDRVTHHCEILETGSYSYPLKQGKMTIQNQ
jgi:DNA replication protein DnaC